MARVCRVMEQAAVEALTLYAVSRTRCTRGEPPLFSVMEVITPSAGAKGLRRGPGSASGPLVPVCFPGTTRDKLLGGCNPISTRGAGSGVRATEI